MRQQNAKIDNLSKEQDKKKRRKKKLRQSRNKFRKNQTPGRTKKEG